MSGQTALLCECLLTLFTFVRFLSRMDSNVPSQVALILELLPTVYTCIRLVYVSRVSFHMSSKTALLRETLLTVLTCKRLFASVYPHMCLQIAFL